MIEHLNFRINQSNSRNNLLFCLSSTTSNDMIYTPEIFLMFAGDSTKDLDLFNTDHQVPIVTLFSLSNI